MWLDEEFVRTQWLQYQVANRVRRFGHGNLASFDFFQIMTIAERHSVLCPQASIHSVRLTVIMHTTSLTKG